MLARIGADLLVLAHFAFILFAVVGGLLVWRWPRVAWLHLPAVVWAAAIELSRGVCPLTAWENSLRRAAGESGYPGGFVEHYLIPIIYPPGLTPTVQAMLGATVIVLNIFVYYGLYLRRSPRS